MTYRWIDGPNATTDEVDQIDAIVTARGGCPSTGH